MFRSTSRPSTSLAVAILGLPPLNQFRAQVFAETNDPSLRPYDSWTTCQSNLRHPASLINFLAAYSTDTFIASQSTEALKRCAAYFVVNGSVPTAPYTCPAVLPGHAAERG